MSGNDVVLVVLAVLLVLMAALAAGAEAAISRTSRVRGGELERDGRTGSTRLRAVLADAPRYVNLLTLLRIVGELVATAFVVKVCLDQVDSAWGALLLGAGVMVLVSYIAVGVAPRTLGRQHSDRVALVAAGVVHPLARVLGPLTQLLIVLGNALTPGKGFREGPFASEAELRDLVDLAQESRVIEAGERAMIHSVFELGDTIVREVMVPRPDVVFVESTKTLRQALSLALRSGYSRIPVIGENIDDVVGIAYLKDLARRTYEYRDAESTERVESVMRPATFVPESKPVDELLAEMQSRRTHCAVVVDEYGGTAGLVTIEDVLEEIVGEITDEYDTEPPMVEHLPDGSLRVSSRLHVEELGELVDLPLKDEDVDSVGGLMAKHLGRVPIPGATVELDGLLLTAESPQGRRNKVGSVLVTREEPATASGGEEAAGG